MPTETTKLRSRAEIAALFRKAYNAEPEFVAATPGRVNLIGEHTDYNDGWVLPMTLDTEVYVALRRRPDTQLNMVSVDFGQKAEWNLNGLEPRPGKAWDAYVAAVYWALKGEGYHVTGADLLVTGDIPQGAGLSSSAALELCVARAACAAGGWQWDPIAMALLGQQAEGQFVGVHCGIMDQIVVAACEPGCALLIDCRKLKLENIPVNLKDAVFVVVDSGVKRELKNSAYNDRRRECEEAYARLLALQPGLLSLSDATLSLLKKADESGAVWHRRARHVLTENARVKKAVEALKAGQAASFGALMTQSHQSLKADFEVSSTELDALVDSALQLEGVYGARLTGAGFGGCTVNLVAAGQVEAFERGIRKSYRQKTGKEAKVYRFNPGSPSRLL